MKRKKIAQLVIGISMLASAICLCITFIVVACRKRSILQAILAVVAAGGAAGAGYFLAKACNDSDDDDDAEEYEDEELFEAEEGEDVEAEIRAELDGTDAQEDAE